MIDINRIKIEDIDEYDGVYTDDGYKLLSNREIESLRELYKTNKIAPKSLVVPTNQEKMTSTNQSNKKNNEVKKNRGKLTLDKNYKVRNFEESCDIRNVIRQGKAFFIAGAVVFVSVFAQSIISNGVDAYRSSSSLDEMIDYQASELEELNASKQDTPGLKDVIFNPPIPSSNLTHDESTIVDFENPLYVESNVSLEEKNAENVDSGLTASTDSVTGSSSDGVEESSKEENVDALAIEKELIKKYCDVYSVNYDAVYNKICQLTNNFTSIDYLSGTIPGVTCKGVQVQSDDREKLLLLTVRIMKQKPEDFDFTLAQISIPVKHPKLGIENATSREVVVDEYHEKIAHYAKIFNLDKCMIHGIVQCETGYSSKRFVEDHNPAGLCMDGKFRTFDSDEEGLIELCTELDKYRSKGCTTIAEIGSIHCPGSDYQAWVDLVTECTEYARSQEDEMFPKQVTAYTR